MVEVAKEITEKVTDDSKTTKEALFQAATEIKNRLQKIAPMKLVVQKFIAINPPVYRIRNHMPLYPIGRMTVLCTIDMCVYVNGKTRTIKCDVWEVFEKKFSNIVQEELKKIADKIQVTKIDMKILE